MAREFSSKSKTFYKGNDKSKGQKPYYKPLPYWSIEATELDGLGRYDGTYKGFRVKEGVYFLGAAATSLRGLVSHKADGVPNMRAIARNKALSKLDDDLTIISSLFEDWYERRQAYALVTSSIKKIVEFSTNWKKPKYWKKLKTGVKQPTALPEAWLAYGFGIQPLIGLLDKSMKGLAQPLPVRAFKGTSGVEYNVAFRGLNVDLQSTTRIYGNVRHLVSFGCHAKPNLNPNYALANATGLNQPFSSAWSVAPWGWAVDYFVNVSELLSNVEHKHPGVDVFDYYETVYDRVSWQGHYGPAAKPLSRLSGSGFEMTRTVLGRNAPKFRITRSFPALGSNQAAYLSSALALTLKGRK